MGEWWARARTFLSEGLWRHEFEPRTWTARGAALLQFAIMVGEGFVRDQLLLRASALTYFGVSAFSGTSQLLATLDYQWDLSLSLNGSQNTAPVPYAIGVMQEFLMTLDMGAGTVSLSIDGVAHPGLQDLPQIHEEEFLNRIARKPP